MAFGVPKLPERDGVLRHPSLLGLELCLEDERLFYFDPARNLRLLTPAEQRTATQKAQTERDRESAARQAAEARSAELERKLGGK